MGVSATINTTDTYQEVVCAGTIRLSLQVLNASIIIGFGQGQRGAPVYYDDREDETLTPMNAQLVRRCNTIRLKSAIVGLPATVFLKALTHAD